MVEAERYNKLTFKLLKLEGLLPCLLLDNIRYKILHNTIFLRIDISKLRVFFVQSSAGKA